MDIISFAKASAASSGSELQLKTVNGNSLKGTGNIAITTYQAFPEDWASYTTSSTKTIDFCKHIDNDATAVIGMGYFGGASFQDKPAGIANFDVVVEILAGPKQNGVATKAIHLIATSSTIYPYRWEYTFWSHSHESGWRGVQSEITVNPQLSGGETNITSLQFGNTLYSVGTLYRHTITMNGHTISVILPFEDTIDNHTAALAQGVVGTLVNSGSSILGGIGYIYWNVDEWAMYDATNTEIISQVSCGDNITALA